MRRRARRLAVAVVSIASLGVPSTAGAQFFPAEPEPGPGITITGSGLARVTAPSRPSERSVQRAIDAAQPTAMRRAIRDARRRAEAIADALGVQLGGLSELELDDGFPQFGPPRGHCRGSHCRVPAATASLATMTLSIAGGAEGADGALTVGAYGSASAPVEPRNPRSNRSIRTALSAARAEVTPKAAAGARRAARTAARSAGLTLGGMVSVSEQRGFYPYDPTLGTFGPGQFCGMVRRSIVRRDPDTGERRVVRRVRRRRCFFPRSFSLRLEVTYEAG